MQVQRSLGIGECRHQYETRVSKNEKGRHTLCEKRFWVDTGAKQPLPLHRASSGWWWTGVPFSSTGLKHTLAIVRHQVGGSADRRSRGMVQSQPFLVDQGCQQRPDCHSHAAELVELVVDSEAVRCQRRGGGGGGGGGGGVKVTVSDPRRGSD